MPKILAETEKADRRAVYRHLWALLHKRGWTATRLASSLSVTPAYIRMLPDDRIPSPAVILGMCQLCIREIRNDQAAVSERLTELELEMMAVSASFHKYELSAE